MISLIILTSYLYFFPHLDLKSDIHQCKHRHAERTELYIQAFHNLAPRRVQSMRKVFYFSYKESFSLILAAVFAKHVRKREE